MAGKVFKLFYACVGIAVLGTVFLLLINPSAGNLNTVDLSLSELADIIETDDFMLRTAAQAVVKECADGDKACMAYRVYHYIYAIYSGEAEERSPYHSETPVFEGVNSPEAKLALLASYLENLEIPVKLLSGAGDTFIAACGISRADMYPLIALESPPRSVLADTIRLAAGQAWIAVPDLSVEGETVAVEFAANGEIEFYVLENRYNTDFNNLGGHYFSECSLTAVREGRLNCFMRRGNTIAVYAPYENARIQIQATVNGLREEDLAVFHYDERECFPFSYSWDNKWLDVSASYNQNEYTVLQALKVSR